MFKLLPLLILFSGNSYGDEIYCYHNNKGIKTPIYSVDKCLELQEKNKKDYCSTLPISERFGKYHQDQFGNIIDCDKVDETNLAYSAKICIYKQTISDQKEVIAGEREKGKIGGVVNMSVLYEAEQTIMETNAAIKDIPKHKVYKCDDIKAVINNY